ncbi:MAG: MarR family winged helix-turn-helix transcriptional regulator [Rubrobacteraceae bacterium]
MIRTDSVPGTVGYALAKVCRGRRGDIGEMLAGLGLHAGQEMVLIELFREDGLRVGELARRLGVEPPTATNMVTRLENRGLVERRQDPSDARCGRVFLTEGGKALDGPIAEIWRRSEEKLLDGLADEERGELLRLLVRVRQNLDPEFEPR